MLVLTDQLQDLQGEENGIKNEAAEVEKAGKRLLPQIPLTVRVVTNYMLKISASRSKTELLARMDEGTMLATMESTGNSENLISKENMSLIMKSMRQKMLSNGVSIISNQLLEKDIEDNAVLNNLDDLVDEELKREAYRQSNVDYNIYMGSSLKLTDDRRRARNRVEDKLFYSLSQKGPLDPTSPGPTRMKKDSKKNLSSSCPYPANYSRNSTPGIKVAGTRGQTGTPGIRGILGMTPISQTPISQCSSRFSDTVEFSQSKLSVPNIETPSVNTIRKKY